MSFNTIARLLIEKCAICSICCNFPEDPTESYMTRCGGDDCRVVMVVCSDCATKAEMENEDDFILCCECCGGGSVKHEVREMLKRLCDEDEDEKTAKRKCMGLIKPDEQCVPLFETPTFFAMGIARSMGRGVTTFLDLVPPDVMQMVSGYKTWVRPPALPMHYIDASRIDRLNIPGFCWLATTEHCYVPKSGYPPRRCMFCFSMAPFSINYPYRMCDSCKEYHHACSACFDLDMNLPIVCIFHQHGPGHCVQKPLVY